jgi:hypothetical protein
VAPSSSDNSPRVACREGDPLWTIPTYMAPESRSWGERLRWPNRSTMNSMLPKWMPLPEARSTPVGLLSLVMNESFGDGITGTSRRKAHCKSPLLAHQLSVFFAPARCRVVKITCSCSEVVLRTTKNYKAHYSLFWFRPLLQGNSPTSSIFVLKKKNNVTMG